MRNGISIEKKIFIALGGFTLLLLLFISPDSYLYDLHSRMDSAWFFMCGKAWMNGLVPYVDFTDSKGPLLWLLYGIGYLLSPHNYTGVFWITVLFYWGAFCLAFKIAKLFLKDNKSAVLCSVLMGLAYFNPWFHDEIRAEDFAQFFMTLSLYEVLLLSFEDYLAPRRIRQSFLILGACFAALVLIKFNIALIQALLIACGFWIAWWKHEGIKPVLYVFFGFFFAALPFLLYFFIAGNLSAFVQEYFINTFKTVSETVMDSDNLILISFPDPGFPFSYLAEWAEIIYAPRTGAMFILLVTSGAIMASFLTKHRWLPILLSLLFFAVTIRHAFYYYFTACAPCLEFLFIGLIGKLRPAPKPLIPVVSVLVLGIVSICHILSYNFKVIFFNDNEARQDYYAVSAYLCQVEKPRIVNAFWAETGLGTLAEALPAGRYWSRQVGATESMSAGHKALILSGEPDFIIIYNRTKFETHLGMSIDILQQLGYKEYVRFGEEDSSSLFSKHELKMVESVDIRQADILLKRAPRIRYQSAP